MKITQEQIEAALRYADDNETAWDNELIDSWTQWKCVNNLLADRYSAASAILAAAYRELLAENAELKSQIEYNELEGEEVAETHDCAD